jgi:hypothetical protein
MVSPGNLAWPSFSPPFAHPKWPHGLAYLIYIDVDLPTQAELWQLGKDLCVPDADQLDDYLDLQPKEAVFARALHLQEQESEDPDIWKMDFLLICVEDRLDLVEQVQGLLMGEPGRQTKYKQPHVPNGTPIVKPAHFLCIFICILATKAPGGLLFEQMQGRSIQSRGGRVYQIGLTYETGKHLVGPSANLKAAVKDQADKVARQNLGNAVSVSLASYFQLRNTQISQVLARQSVQAMEFALARDQGRLNLLRAMAIVSNAPIIGDPENVFHPQYQVNVSVPVLYGSGEKLDGQLGFSGGAHTDGKDDSISYSNMLCASRLRPTTHPGFFLLIMLRIRVRLNPGRSVTFTGLLLHGSTPPVAGNGLQVGEEEARLVIIGYPGAGVGRRYDPTTGNPVSFAFAPAPPSCLPDPNIIAFPPFYQTQPSVRASFAVDGPLIMPSLTFRSWFGRELYSLNSYFLSFLPSSHHFKLDPTAFRHSLYWEDDEGVPHPVLWPEDLDAESVWRAVYESETLCGRFIPLWAFRKLSQGSDSSVPEAGVEDGDRDEPVYIPGKH